MNLKTNQKGFTIVELLIVIVVIAILAAISIVAYVGIQNNARASERNSDATNIAKVAETHLAQYSSYPTTKADFEKSDLNAQLPANVKVNVATGATTATDTADYGKAGADGTKTYTVQRCGTDGGKVHYWDPRTGKGAASVNYGRGC